MEGDKYLNFPVTLLRDAFKDISQTMEKVMDYAGYVHTLKLEHGSNEKKMKDAGDYFGMTYYNSVGSFERGRSIHNSTPKNTPHVGINKNMAFDFYDNPKTQDEIAVLLAYLAIKSIIGNKPYIKLTNEFLIARMAGCATIAELPSPLPLTLAQYATRRKLDKIKFELQTAWNVNIYSRYVRGFYVSLDKKFSIDRLVLEAEKRRKSNIEKQRRDQLEAARLKALKTLFTN